MSVYSFQFTLIADHHPAPAPLPKGKPERCTCACVGMCRFDSHPRVNTMGAMRGRVGETSERINLLRGGTGKR